MSKVKFNWKKLGGAAALALGTSIAAAPTMAGQFYASCYTSDKAIIEECASGIADLVTDRFTDRFSANAYKLFIASSSMVVGAKDYGATATVGVVKRHTDDLFPMRRQTHMLTGTTNDGGRPGPILLHEAEVWVVRDAVKAIMESCAVTPNCDVHEER